MSNEKLLSECTLYKALYEQNYYGNVICNGLALDTFKVSQCGFLKVAALKRTKRFIRKTIKKMHC